MTKEDITWWFHTKKKKSLQIIKKNELNIFHPTNWEKFYELNDPPFRSLALHELNFNH
jgi:hypothetical protein